MAESTLNNHLQLILASMAGMFGLALGLVVFVLTYQRRLFKQKQEHQAKEAEYQQQLLRANLLSQERERNRIGKDLHDSVGSLLTTARLYFRQISKDKSDDSFDTLKNKAISLLDQTMTSVRRVSHDLKPVVLEELGLAEAIGNMITQINDSGTLQIDYQYHIIHDMDKEYELNWYRITQELVQNTIKHAQATQVNIRLGMSAQFLVMHYTDNGIGLHQAHTGNKGLGIKNIESRLSLMSGHMEYPTEQHNGLALILKSKLKP